MNPGLPREKCTMIFGAGAVENAWAPVAEAVSADSGSEVDEDNANFAFAQYVHTLRFLDHVENDPHANRLQGTSLIGETKGTVAARLAALKSNIASNIKRDMASNKLRARLGVLRTVIELASDNEFFFVNTNWDTAVDHVLGRRTESLHEGRSTFHLHGHFRQPQEMYFPAETSFEPYLERSTLVERKEKHGRLIDGVLESSLIVLYGLSLSPMDAELASVIAAGVNHRRMRMVILVGLKKDRPVIEGRLRMLINPDLSNPVIDYRNAEDLDP